MEQVLPPGTVRAVNGTVVAETRCSVVRGRGRALFAGLNTDSTESGLKSVRG